MGFLTHKGKKGTTDITAIILNDEAIPDIEKYLEAEYGIKPKEKQLEEFRKLLEKYKNCGRLCEYECRTLRTKIEERKTPSDGAEKEDRILKALQFIETNTQQLYLKEASILIFGQSHALDPGNKDFGYILECVCRIIREADGKPQQYYEQLDDILNNYKIKKEPETIRLKGPVRLVIDGREIDVSQFKGGIEFIAEQKIEKITLDAETFVTVENKTTFNRMDCRERVVFYLGGYGNRFQKKFICSVFADNPNAKYLHAGDIDVNGFWIHHDLCRSTNVPFSLFCMSVKELSNPLFRDCLNQLTENDKQRISQLKEIAEYRETAEFMERNNVKLEQEIISLSNAYS